MGMSKSTRCCRLLWRRIRFGRRGHRERKWSLKDHTLFLCCSYCLILVSIGLPYPPLSLFSVWASVTKCASTAKLELYKYTSQSFLSSQEIRPETLLCSFILSLSSFFIYLFYYLTFSFYSYIIFSNFLSKTMEAVFWARIRDDGLGRYTLD